MNLSLTDDLLSEVLTLRRENDQLKTLLREAQKYVAHYHGHQDRPVTRSDLYKRIELAFEGKG